MRLARRGSPSGSEARSSSDVSPTEGACGAGRQRAGEHEGLRACRKERRGGRWEQEGAGRG
eukprot:140602-Chlamydomonas_euryale.AAC.1